MSLYTPVFPSGHEFNSSQKHSPESVSETSPEKQQCYIGFLRDVHLFLSTKNDVLSPPSRPNSPQFDHRAEKAKEEIQGIFRSIKGNTSSGSWTSVSQTLKLGCMRNKRWPVLNANPHTPDQVTNWILPDEESEWLELEKKRQENRRLRATTNASQQIGRAATAEPDSLKPNHASVADLSHPCDKMRERPPRDVSPTTLRTAKDKVKRWQASVASEVWHSTRGPSTSSMRPATATAVEIGKPQRNRTIDFAVVKSAAKPAIGKRGKGSLLRPAVPGGSASSPRHSQASAVPGPVDVEKTDSKRPSKTSREKDTPKIGDIPETPYLPPSFPAHLETSTPLPDPLKLVRAKPSPIIPLATSPSTPSVLAVVDLADDRELAPAEPHAANESTSLPPPINIVQSGKRTRARSSSLHGSQDDTCATPPAKRLQTLSHSGSGTSSKHARSISPTGESHLVPCTGDDARVPSGAEPSHRRHEMPSAVPLTPGEKDQPATNVDVQTCLEKVSSPTKSVRSYFSTPGSDLADSPVKANLLLESPVSPMLSYARNPSEFLPQLTSTQVGSGSPTMGRTNSGAFGMGYSSQFDVEQHVDRVSELLEKEVDLDGWLRDMKAVETCGDQQGY